jgi:CBS-domain-containing membrane protein
VHEGDKLEEVMRLMEAHQIRRVPVVGEGGEICGIVSQADIARRTSHREAGELVREVSAPR